MRLIIALCCFSTFAMNTVKVGLFALEPYAKMVDGNPQGIMYQFLNEVDEEMSDVKFRYDVFPYNRMINQLKGGDIELAVFYENNKAGTNELKAFETLGNINYIIGATLYSKDIEKLKLGLIRLASYGPEIDDIAQDKKIFLKTYDQGIKMLKYRRISHLVIPSTTFYDYCKKNSLECEKDIFKNKTRVNEKNNWVHVKNISLEVQRKIKQAHDKVIKKKKYQYLHDLL